MNRADHQPLLTAVHPGGAVTVGLDSAESLRALSDARLLTCPACGEPLTLHAGPIRAHHFAHRPGAVCSMTPAEPETEEHRAGKLLIARWILRQLPAAEIRVEAPIAETGQRADVYAEVRDGRVRRVAIEFQCADLSGREWQRRHRLYRDAGYLDLWILGASRYPCLADSASPGSSEQAPITAPDLERALLMSGFPLLFLDPLGRRVAAESLFRPRLDPGALAVSPTARFSARPLLELPFPWHLAERADVSPPIPDRPQESLPGCIEVPAATLSSSDRQILDWLTARYHVNPEALPALCGVPITGQETFGCQPRSWQAALYYRFVHQQVGSCWNLAAVAQWAHAYLPLARPVRPARVRAALSAYQEILCAAGLLSLPFDARRTRARVTADLTTLATPPDLEAVQRLALYRSAHSAARE